AGSDPSPHPRFVNVSVFNPTLYFATALRDRLIASGIDVRGAPADLDELTGERPAGHSPVLTHRSAPLRELAVTMMKNSQNLYAETLLRTTGGRPATFQAARMAAESVLSEWGVGSTDVVI